MGCGVWILWVVRLVAHVYRVDRIVHLRANPGSVVLCVTRSLYQLEVRGEKRDVWKLYLGLAREKGSKHFATALEYASVCAARVPTV